MSTLEVLKAARARLEKGWCQNMLACDKYGNATYDEKEAVGWCAIGALYFCTEYSQYYITQAMHELSELVGPELDFNVVSYNNRHSKAEVLALFDKAIALEKRSPIVPE